nr:Clp protease N-terminal domain-containing protein [Rhodococcus wratislaviensis]GLK40574.1 hypothetical protein GCM10017611_74490 [Rhodococcus wratislaviensis]
MFERFTDPARRVLVLATNDAQTRNCDYVGTEHILMGLINEGDGVAAKTLESIGISAAVIGNRLPDMGHDPPHRPGHIPFTQHAKKVLEQSLRETCLLGHDHIGTEHLLLALLDDSESTGARLLGEDASVDVDQLRQHILRHVAESRRTPESAGPTNLTNIRLTDTEHALCAVAAAKAGQRIDVWMREKVLDAARAHHTDTDAAAAAE